MSTESIKRSNTSKPKEIKPVEKREKLTQLEIDIVEAKLSLSTGALLQDIGAFIANRFGKALAEKDAATTAMSYLDKIKNIDERKKKTLETRKAFEAAKVARKEEVGKYTKLASEYIVATYGKEIRNESNRLIGYGDKIEVLKNRNLTKTW